MFRKSHKSHKSQVLNLSTSLPGQFLKAFDLRIQLDTAGNV
jgi:hypothetical protein